MNKYERRRKTAKGINLIEEVVADVLDEARDNNEGELTSTEVKKRAGCPSLEDKVFLGLMRDMASSGEVVNENPGQGPGRWRLAD